MSLNGGHTHTHTHTQKSWCSNEQKMKQDMTSAKIKKNLLFLINKFF